MFSNFHYTYLVGDLLMLPLWLGFFFYRKDLRKEILIAGFCIGFLATILAPWSLKDYWRPEYSKPFFFSNPKIGGVEDFLYGFFIGGISNVVYEVFLGKRYAKRKDRKHRWGWFLIPFFILYVLAFAIPVTFGMNSIYALIISSLALSCFMVYFRKDLFLDSLISGVAVCVLTFVHFKALLLLFPWVVRQWWLLPNMNGVLVVGIPVEELLWAFGLGMVAGPFWEFFVGLKFRKS